MELYNTSSYKVIYIFSMPDDAHKGLIKIGDATIHTNKSLNELTPNCDALREAADKGRIKDYTFTVGVKVDLLWAELAIKQKVEEFNGSKVTIIQAFRDYDVHNVLKNSGKKIQYPNGIKNREWFECDLETAKNAIKAVKENRDFLKECEKSDKPIFKETIKLREEQQGAVDKTLGVFHSKDDMLWNCKMRFGKTLTAYELIRTGKYQKTIVVTHRPVVEKGWREDHEKLFGKDSQHVFMKKQGLIYSDDYFDVSSDIKNDRALTNAKNNGEYFTYFASMQDLRGSKLVNGKFDKNKAVFAMDWDLIIYDEAHEGTQTELGKAVQALLEAPKNGKKPKVLELSGTPYNIMDKYDENVYTWDYVMEQDAKATWEAKHPGEVNPYADMPKMNIFTFDISNALSNSFRYETETTAFNFREFFRVWTGDKEKDFGPVPTNSAIGRFVHEDDVKSFLRLISTDSEETKYPFATYEFRQQFKHTLWMLPGVKEANALSKLLKRDAVFSHYEIANVAGDGDEEKPYDNALDLVQEAIAKNPFTITLSCGKLTTGVTVREWTAVMMLTGSATTDAKGYMQTIFRVQSAGSIDGKQKENCYVFDFAPDRTLKVLSDVYQITKRGSISEEKYREELKKFINFCPVISIDGTKMKKYEVNQMIKQIKRISIDNAIKSGFDDESIYKVDTGIVMDEKDKEFFNMLKNKLSGQKRAQRDSSVTMASNGMSNEEYEKAKKAEKKPKKELTPEEKAMFEKLKEQRKQRQTFIALLRNISIRLPLLIYGANVPLNENLTLEKFVDIIDPESWQEFMPKDVSTDIFRRSIKYFDEDVLIAAGLRIRRLAKQADEYPPLERVKRITELFSHFRNPDKETVLTPWRVVNMHLSDTLGGYDFYDETHSKVLEKPRFVNQGKVTFDTLSNSNATILEINSKSGVYPLYVAYSIFKTIVGDKEKDMSVEEQYKIWNKVITENIFVLCKTPMAKCITQRTLAGFSPIKCRARYQPHLIENMKDNPDWVVKKLKNPTSWEMEGEERMKFDAIVGNPPYQMSDGGAQASATPVYNLFVDVSKKLNANYISMIMPSRWMTGGKGLDKFRDDMIHDKHFLVLHDYLNPKDCFSNVDIKGGVCYFLRDKNTEAPCKITSHTNEGLYKSTRYLAEDGDNIFIRENRLLQIKNRVFAIQTEMFDSIVSARKPYGLEAETMLKASKYGLPDFSNEPYKNGYRILGLGEKQKRMWKYIPKDYPIPKRNIALNKYKVFIAEAYGCGAIGEVASTPVLSTPGELCTETFLQIGPFETEIEANYCCKYIYTKFFRAMVGIQKQTQHTTQKAYRFVPLQNFTDKSDIDWSKSVAEIDKQLYKKYNLTKEEIDFIEKTVKPME